MSPPSSSSPIIPVSAKDLPATCPPKAQWNLHPRVFLLFKPQDDGQQRAQCPYCGAVYQLEGAAMGAAHH